jgi:hypothetical protein
LAEEASEVEGGKKSGVWGKLGAWASTQGKDWKEKVVRNFELTIKDVTFNLNLVNVRCAKLPTRQTIRDPDMTVASIGFAMPKIEGFTTDRDEPEKKKFITEKTVINVNKTIIISGLKLWCHGAANGGNDLERLRHLRFDLPLAEREGTTGGYLSRARNAVGGLATYVPGLNPPSSGGGEREDNDDMQGLISVHLSAVDCACLVAIANALVHHQYSPPIDEIEEAYQTQKAEKEAKAKQAKSEGLRQQRDGLHPTGEELHSVLDLDGDGIVTEEEMAQSGYKLSLYPNLYVKLKFPKLNCCLKSSDKVSRVVDRVAITELSMEDVVLTGYQVPIRVRVRF